MNRFIRNIGSTGLLLLLSLSFATAQVKGFMSGRPLPAKGLISVIGGAGVAYYMGDLRDGVDFGHLGLGPALSIGASYRFTEHLSLRAELRGYHVSADQKYSKNYSNNLSFRTTNPDLFVGIQADLFRFSRQARVNPYLVAGGGVTYLRPQARLDGQWHNLAPLTTEGKKYSRLPFFYTGGIGFLASLTERWSVGLELSNNFLLSDYLDDASDKYPNPDALPSDLARRLSDRAAELPGGQARNAGDIRGNPDSMDAYLFFKVRTQYLLASRQFVKERKKTRCPKFR